MGNKVPESPRAVVIISGSGGGGDAYVPPVVESSENPIAETTL